MDNKKPQDQEDRRFVISGAIIASFLAIMALGDNMPVMLTALYFFLGVSALLSAIYLITTAAILKYHDPGMLYQVVTVDEKFRKRMYDWSIDIFGLYLISLIGGLVLSGLFKDFYENMQKENSSLLVFLIIVFGTTLFSIIRLLVWVVGKIQKRLKK